MQHQALSPSRRGCGIEAVADNRVAQRREMHAQLVAAAGDRRESDAGSLRERIACKHGEMCRRRFANRVINHLPRPVGPIANQGQIDGARVVHNQAVRDRNIVFADRALFKRAADRTLRSNAAREHHQARGLHIETMYDQRIGELSLYTSAQAVLFVWPATGDGQQAAGLIDNDESFADRNDR